MVLHLWITIATTLIIILKLFYNFTQFYHCWIILEFYLCRKRKTIYKINTIKQKWMFIPFSAPKKWQQKQTNTIYLTNLSKLYFLCREIEVNRCVKLSSTSHQWHHQTHQCYSCCFTGKCSSIFLWFTEQFCTCILI